AIVCGSVVFVMGRQRATHVTSKFAASPAILIAERMAIIIVCGTARHAIHTHCEVVATILYNLFATHIDNHSMSGIASRGNVFSVMNIAYPSIAAWLDAKPKCVRTAKRGVMVM